MTLDEAFVKAARSYFDGSNSSEFDRHSGTKRKYVKAYFDSIEEEFGLNQKAKDEKEMKKLRGKK